MRCKFVLSERLVAESRAVLLVDGCRSVRLDRIMQDVSCRNVVAVGSHEETDYGCYGCAPQHQNRARAMSLLQSRILAAQEAKRSAEIAASRKLQVGSGDSAERIRTCNFPQGRLTRHRFISDTV